jgi:CHAT domain-containing protein
MALAMLGRYDEAIATGEAALRVFNKRGDTLAAGKIEMNLSNIVARREEYRKSISYCLSAAKKFNSLGELQWLTMAQNDLGRCYAEVNDFRKAEQYYEMALATARDGKMSVTEAEILASMGSLASFRSRYAEALAHFESSRAVYLRLQMSPQVATTDAEIAGVYSELNLTEEAVSIYKRAIAEFVRYKMTREEAIARVNCGKAASMLGDRTVAKNQFRRATKLFDKQGNTAALAFTQLDLAVLESNDGNHEAALGLSARATDILGPVGFLRQRLTAQWVRARAFEAEGRLAEAEVEFTDLKSKAKRAEQSGLVHAALTSLGDMAFSNGAFSSAVRHYRGAMKVVEESRASFGSEQFRRTFVANRLRPFEKLVQTYLAQNRIVDAFRTIETFRSRALLESIAGLNSPDRRDRSETPGAKLREDLNWLYKKYDTTIHDQDSAELLSEIRLAEERLAQLKRETEAGQLNTTDTAAPAAIGVRLLQKSIGRSRAIVEFVRVDNVYSAFVVTNAKVHFVSDLIAEEELNRDLAAFTFQLETMSHGARLSPVISNRIDDKIHGLLERLYTRLIEPVNEIIGKRDLIIVPTRSLHHLPFHALRRGGEPLIARHEIRYAPSASVWHRLSSRPDPSIKSALVMGYADENIPTVEQEIAAVGKVFPRARVLGGDEASYRAFNLEAPRADLIHLACHGRFRADDPMLSSLHLADGWITARDVGEQRLKARLVTLSACESGTSKIYPGDEPLGFARGFLAAGARSLIVSLWKIDDAATGEFMRVLYENLQRGSTVAASIQEAQKWFIRSGASPYLWAPFVLIGD